MNGLMHYYQDRRQSIIVVKVPVSPAGLPEIREESWRRIPASLKAVGHPSWRDHLMNKNG
jgi:hypothetical protein